MPGESHPGVFLPDTLRSESMRKRNLTAISLAMAACAALGSAAHAQLDEDFDGYTPGSTLAGQGGWELWYTGGVDAVISNAVSNSPSNSLRLEVLSDLVYEFTGITEGKWVYTAWTYMPSTATGDAYLILMNGYGSSSLDNWSMQVRFGANDQLVESDFGAETIGLITDQWVEFRAEIDLDEMFDFGFEVGSMDLFYNGVQFADDLIWIENAGTAGQTTIACNDVFSLDCNEFYVDDISLLPAGGCIADYNGLPEAGDILDFLDFFEDFAACDQLPGPCGTYGDADVNGDTIVDILDFLDFFESFGNGC